MHSTAKYPLNLLLNQLKLYKYSNKCFEYFAELFINVFFREFPQGK